MESSSDLNVSDDRKSTKTLLEDVCADFETMDVIHSKMSKPAITRPKTYSKIRNAAEKELNVAVSKQTTIACETSVSTSLPGPKNLIIESTGASTSYYPAIQHNPKLSVGAACPEEPVTQIVSDVPQNSEGISFISESQMTDLSSLAQLADAEIVQTDDHSVSIIITNPRLIKVTNSENSPVVLGSMIDTASGTMETTADAIDHPISIVESDIISNIEIQDMDLAITGDTSLISNLGLRDKVDKVKESKRKTPVKRSKSSPILLHQPKVSQKKRRGRPPKVREPIHPITIGKGGKRTAKPKKSIFQDNRPVTKARRITAKMKETWAEVLQKTGHLKCNLGCNQTYVTVANFITHYKFCTGKKSLQHCNYCDSLIFSSDTAVMQHMEVEHPEKLEEYKAMLPEPVVEYDESEVASHFLVAEDENVAMNVEEVTLNLFGKKKRKLAFKENLVVQPRAILKNNIKSINEKVNENIKEFKKCVRFDQIVDKINSVEEFSKVVENVSEPRPAKIKQEPKPVKTEQVKRKYRKHYIKAKFVEEKQYFEDDEDDIYACNIPDETPESEQIMHTKARMVLNLERYKRYKEYLKVTRDWSSERRTYSRSRGNDSSLNNSFLLALKNECIKDMHQLRQLEDSATNVSLNSDETYELDSITNEITLKMANQTPLVTESDIAAFNSIERMPDKPPILAEPNQSFSRNITSTPVSRNNNLPTNISLDLSSVTPVDMEQQVISPPRHASSVFSKGRIPCYSRSLEFQSDATQKQRLGITYGALEHFPQKPPEASQITFDSLVESMKQKQSGSSAGGEIKKQQSLSGKVNKMIGQKLLHMQKLQPKVIKKNLNKSAVLNNIKFNAKMRNAKFKISSKLKADAQKIARLSMLRAKKDSMKQIQEKHSQQVLSSLNALKDSESELPAQKCIQSELTNQIVVENDPESTTQCLVVDHNYSTADFVSVDPMNIVAEEVEIVSTNVDDVAVADKLNVEGLEASIEQDRFNTQKAVDCVTLVNICALQALPDEPVDIVSKNHGVTKTSVGKEIETLAEIGLTEQDASLNKTVDIPQEFSSEVQEVIMEGAEIASVDAISAKEKDVPDTVHPVPLSTELSEFDKDKGIAVSGNLLEESIAADVSVSHDGSKKISEEQVPDESATNDEVIPPVVKRGRGRPRKYPALHVPISSECSPAVEAGKKIDRAKESINKVQDFQFSDERAGVRKSERVKKRKLAADEIPATPKIEPQMAVTPKPAIKHGRRGRPRKYPVDDSHASVHDAVNDSAKQPEAESADDSLRKYSRKGQPRKCVRYVDLNSGLDSSESQDGLNSGARLKEKTAVNKVLEDDVQSVTQEKQEEIVLPLKKRKQRKGKDEVVNVDVSLSIENKDADEDKEIFEAGSLETRLTRSQRSRKMSFKKRQSEEENIEILDDSSSEEQINKDPDYTLENYRKRTLGRVFAPKSPEEMIKYARPQPPKSLFVEYKPNRSMWQLLHGKDYHNFLPPLQHSIYFKIKKSWSQTESDWTTLKCFDSLPLDENTTHNTFFTGGPVLSSAWCPIPLEIKQIQYIALSISSNLEKYHSYTSTEPEKGMIQIWNVGFLRNVLDSKPVMELGISHNHGIIPSMAWCPSGCWEDPSVKCNKQSMPRLGLLALACSDSYVRVYSIPHPQSLTSEKKSHPLYSSSPSIILKPLYGGTCLATSKSVCVCVAWQKSDSCERIAAGYGNGMICIWFLNSSSTILATKEKDQLILSPYLAFSAHGTPISSLSFSPISGARFLLSSSIDKTVKFWDLSDTSLPFYSIRKGPAKGAEWVSPFAGALVAVESSTFFKECGTENYSYRSCSNSSCSILNMSLSAWLNAQAFSDASGVLAVSFCNYFSSEHKTMQYFERPVYQVESKCIQGVLDRIPFLTETEMMSCDIVLNQTEDVVATVNRLVMFCEKKTNVGTLKVLSITGKNVPQRGKKRCRRDSDERDAEILSRKCSDITDIVSILTDVQDVVAALTYSTEHSVSSKITKSTAHQESSNQSPVNISDTNDTSDDQANTSESVRGKNIEIEDEIVPELLTNIMLCVDSKGQITKEAPKSETSQLEVASSVEKVVSNMLCSSADTPEHVYAEVEGNKALENSEDKVLRNGLLLNDTVTHMSILPHLDASNTVIHIIDIVNLLTDMKDLICTATNLTNLHDDINSHLPTYSLMAKLENERDPLFIIISVVDLITDLLNKTSEEVVTLPEVRLLLQKIVSEISCEQSMATSDSIVSFEAGLPSDFQDLQMNFGTNFSSQDQEKVDNSQLECLEICNLVSLISDVKDVVSTLTSISEKTETRVTSLEISNVVSNLVNKVLSDLTGPCAENSSKNQLNCLSNIFKDITEMPKKYTRLIEVLKVITDMKDVVSAVAHFADPGICAKSETPSTTDSRDSTNLLKTLCHSKVEQEWLSDLFMCASDADDQADISVKEVADILNNLVKSVEEENSIISSSAAECDSVMDDSMMDSKQNRNLDSTLIYDVSGSTPVLELAVLGEIVCSDSLNKLTCVSVDSPSIPTLTACNSNMPQAESCGNTDSQPPQLVSETEDQTMLPADGDDSSNSENEADTDDEACDYLFDRDSNYSGDSYFSECSLDSNISMGSSSDESYASDMSSTSVPNDPQDVDFADQSVSCDVEKDQNTASKEFLSRVTDMNLSFKVSDSSKLSNSGSGLLQTESMVNKVDRPHIVPEQSDNISTNELASDKPYPEKTVTSDSVYITESISVPQNSEVSGPLSEVTLPTPVCSSLTNSRTVIESSLHQLPEQSQKRLEPNMEGVTEDYIQMSSGKDSSSTDTLGNSNVDCLESVSCKQVSTSVLESVNNVPVSEKQYEKKSVASAFPEVMVVDSEEAEDALSGSEEESNKSGKRLVTYEEIMSENGLIFTDMNTANFESIEGKSEDTSTLPNHRHNLTFINTVAFNPNYGAHHWLLSAGQSGIARLSYISSIDSEKLFKRKE